MRKRSVLWENQIMKSAGVLLAMLFILSACGGSNTPSTTSGNTSQPKPPIKIGISVSLSGDFSADGKAFHSREARRKIVCKCGQ